MRLADLHQATITAAREVKEAVAPRALPSVVLAFRGAELIAQVHLRDCDGPKLRRAIHTTTLGFTADRVATAFEGWDSRSMTNPDTGAEWEHGEMEEYVQAHGGVDDVVGESLIVHVATAGEDAATTSLPFTYAGDALVWGQAEDMGPSQGAVPEALAHALSRVGQSSMFLAQIRHLYPQGKSEEHLQATADAMCGQVLTEQFSAAVVLSCEERQSERYAVLVEHGMILDHP